MQTNSLKIIVVTTLASLVFGCSRPSAAPDVSEQPANPQPSLGLAATASRPMTDADDASRPQEDLTPENEFPPPHVAADELNPPDAFGPTPFGPGVMGLRIVVPLIETTSSDDQDPIDAPRVKLLGFADANGLRSLLADETTLNVVSFETGKGEIIAVESPNLTVRQGDEEFDLSLFDRKGIQTVESVFDDSGFAMGDDLQASDMPGFPTMDNEAAFPPLPLAFPRKQDGQPAPGNPPADALPGLPGPDRPGGLPGEPGFEDDPGDPAATELPDHGDEMPDAPALEDRKY